MSYDIIKFFIWKCWVITSKYLKTTIPTPIKIVFRTMREIWVGKSIREATTSDKSQCQRKLMPPRLLLTTHIKSNSICSSNRQLERAYQMASVLELQMQKLVRMKISKLSIERDCEVCKAPKSLGDRKRQRSNLDQIADLAKNNCNNKKRVKLKWMLFIRMSSHLRMTSFSLTRMSKLDSDKGKWFLSQPSL